MPFHSVHPTASSSFLSAPGPLSYYLPQPSLTGKLFPKFSPRLIPLLTAPLPQAFIVLSRTYTHKKTFRRKQHSVRFRRLDLSSDFISYP